MAGIICPVCGRELSASSAGLCCSEGHTFDRARQGYINLLTVDKKHSLHPGDTRQQVADRKAFLDSGWYKPISDALGEILMQESPKSILDAGCGEGYYLSQVRKLLPNSQMFGLDISKDAVRYASVRDKSITWLVGTASHLPFPESSFDCIISMFALTVPEEFRRVLRPGGLFIQVLAHPEHLMALKRIIYPVIIHKEKLQCVPITGFALEKTIPLDFSFTLPNPVCVQQLLGMTPHVYRIGKDGAQRLRDTQTLTDEAKVLFNLYRAL